jgi:hypothetical protein
MIQRGPISMLLLLFCTGVVHSQMPFIPKFLASAESPYANPYLEHQRDALNLHEGDASVSLAEPITINCTVRGTDFTATLLQKGSCSRSTLRGANAKQVPSRIALDRS